VGAIVSPRLSASAAHARDVKNNEEMDVAIAMVVNMSAN
jgi:hypothetical protein